MAMSVVLSGCFTGIESTPRITGADVKASGADRPSEEALLGAKIAGETPKAWTNGKQWHVTDAKIAVILRGAAEEQIAPGSSLILTAMETSPSVKGYRTVDVILADSTGCRFTYATDVMADEMAGRESLQIPFAVEMSAVERADSLMRGHKYYAISSRWCDASGRLSADGLRYVPVTVNAVLPGTTAYPLKVAFTTPADTATHYIMMTYGQSAAATRNFQTLFSLTDPRAKYPEITDTVWEKIVHSQVTDGMTRDECRLALGIPDNIVRGASTSAQIERWSYGDGTWLMFEDGILTSFRR